MGNSKPVEKKTKKKKKGRPSLLDLQKRSLRLQLQQHRQQHDDHKRNPNPNPSSPAPNPYLRFPLPSSARRSTRRNPGPDPSPCSSSDDEHRCNGRRREKKLKLVLLLPSANSAASASNSDAEASAGARNASAGGDQDKVERRKHFKTMDSRQGDPPDSGPTTPLPDKKLLVFILDRLQKKDTFGVFSEPVDPEELPNYRDIIENPMDFGTIRNKLANGAYANLEQFENDVFLISSNAMLYNAPDTIYYRQARAIQELAQKNFENLRQESDDNEVEPKPVVRRGRPPKNKKAVGGPSEHSASDFPSEATLANSTNNIKCLNNTYELGITGVTTRSSQVLQNSQTASWVNEQKVERNEDYSGFALRGFPAKYRKKATNTIIDENRRNTYEQPQLSTYMHELPVLTIPDGDKKQLVPVGLHLEHACARSLARFAANLGPVGWAIAAKRMQRLLPPETDFGPGWVGHCESRTPPPLPSHQFKMSPCTSTSGSNKLSERQEPSSNERALPTSMVSGDENGVSSSSAACADNIRPKAPFQLYHNTGMQPAPLNGFSIASKSYIPQQLGKMIKSAELPQHHESYARDCT